jgi:hypothetical protein
MKKSTSKTRLKAVQPVEVDGSGNTMADEQEKTVSSSKKVGSCKAVI